MSLDTIIIILFVPTRMFFIISLNLIKKLNKKIYQEVEPVKGGNTLLEKSLQSSDILLEIFLPKKYSKKYPKEFKKIRFFSIPAAILFLPTIILISYSVFSPYLENKALEIPLLLIGIFIVFLLVGLFIRKNHNIRK